MNHSDYQIRISPAADTSGAKATEEALGKVAQAAGWLRRCDGYVQLSVSSLLHFGLSFGPSNRSYRGTMRFGIPWFNQSACSKKQKQKSRRLKAEIKL
jgi:hypothetical protein